LNIQSKKSATYHERIFVGLSKACCRYATSCYVGGPAPAAPRLIFFPLPDSAPRESPTPRQPIISLNEIRILLRSQISSHQDALFPLQSRALSPGLRVHPSGADEQVDIISVTSNNPDTRLTKDFHDIVPAHSQCKVRPLLLHSPPDLSPLLYCQHRSVLNNHKSCPGSRPQHCLPLPRCLRCSLSNHNRAVPSQQPHIWESSAIHTTLHDEYRSDVLDSWPGTSLRRDVSS